MFNGHRIYFFYSIHFCNTAAHVNTLVKALNRINNLLFSIQFAV